MEVRELNPTIIWDYFDRITQIPRPSKKEDKIIQYLMDFAKQHNLEAKKDKAGNILICKPATPGKENLQTVILQSHVDMVCEKNSDVQFDFEKDPIQTYIDGDWVKAKGTTLGGDDGIGVAAQLAILASKDIEHGPVMALFTTDEETGLTGANELDASFLDGDILLNLDSEDWGEFCIGCAGGRHTVGTFKYKSLPAPKDYFWFEVQVSGLNGGHSGSDIHKGLGNANKILARYLWILLQECPLLISEIDGGNLHNAIPREANAILGVPIASKERTSVLANILQAELSQELAHIDKNVKLSIKSAETPRHCVDFESGKNLINTLYALPHGVIGMSFDMPGTVETSTNLASVKMKEGHQIKVTTSQRSSTNSLKEDICNMVESVFNLGDAEISANKGYPGWKPNPDSSILNVSTKVYEKLTNETPRIVSIHAGLECGLFLERNPKLDMISCGPTLVGVHSPDEKLQISTVEKWWNFLIELLKEIPAK